jgi:hypothetical protein
MRWFRQGRLLRGFASSLGDLLVRLSYLLFAGDFWQASFYESLIDGNLHLLLPRLR